MKKALVSVLIPNYNYGRYLRGCLESVFEQTYDNMEVIFRDNASTDESYEIALEYRKKFEEKGIYFSISRNKRNVGSDQNTRLCLNDAEGDYMLVLSSDDAIKPTFVERCADILNKNSEVVLVMTHRDEIDENGQMYVTPPFYNEDCIVRGEDQAAVFMMAGIAVPSQRMFRSGVSGKVKNFRYSFQVAGDWFNNFLHACVGDIAYVKDALCQYRVHGGNETNASEKNMLGIFEHYQLISAFVSIADCFKMSKPQQRYEEAVKKLGSMSLRYAYKMLKCEEREIAQKYLMLANIFDDTILNSEPYKALAKCIALKDSEYREQIEWIEDNFFFARTTSYAPPEGYIKIDKHGNKL